MKSKGAGFTLVEVLVALVITSLVVSILMGLMSYIYRVQDSLRGELVEREFDLRVRQWFSSVVEGCLPEKADSPAAFNGAVREFSCETTAPLRPREVTMSLQVSFKIQDGENGQKLLAYAQVNDSEKQAVPILRLPEGDVSFVYEGVDGKPVEAWMPAPGREETLPRKVRLVVRKASNETMAWVAAPRADPWLEPVVTNPFGPGAPQ